MYKVALCEDEKFYAKSQGKICRDILENLHIEYLMSVFESSADFWSAFSKGKRYDLILMDIVMDDIDGMELARKIREHDSDTAIVFVTASAEYALQGYGVKALHYLMKPLNPEFLEGLISADYKKRFRQKFLVIKTAAQHLKIPVRDIICLETVGRRVAITTTDGMIDYPSKLSELMEELPGDCFIRCHVGYVINVGSIKKLTRTEAVAVNDKIIPVSRAYSENTKKAFMKQLWEI